MRAFPGFALGPRFGGLLSPAGLGGSRLAVGEEGWVVEVRDLRLSEDLASLADDAAASHPRYLRHVGRPADRRGVTGRDLGGGDDELHLCEHRAGRYVSPERVSWSTVSVWTPPARRLRMILGYRLPIPSRTSFVSSLSFMSPVVSSSK